MCLYAAFIFHLPYCGSNDLASAELQGERNDLFITVLCDLSLLIFPSVARTQILDSIKFLDKVKNEGKERSLYRKRKKDGEGGQRYKCF